MSHRQVCRALDDEHRTTLEFLGRLEQAFARLPAGAGRDPALADLARRLGQHLEGEVWRHFDFEERELFPRLVDSGDAGVAGLLAEEHAAIREVGAELLPLTRGAAVGVLPPAGWDALRHGVLELVERQVAHIQKESMALIPLLDDILDDDTDRELAFAYAAG
jgi:iron-sulfur cluster repair protein YtfE (RIC family)